MSLLAFKVTIAPLLLLAASLAIRRWGESIGGLIVGLPLTSAPISLFLALEQGPAFAAQATAGSLTATIAQVACAFAYCRLADRGWPVALAACCAAFVAAAVPLQMSGLSQVALFVAALAAVMVALRFIPRPAVQRRPVATPGWDLPVRMALVVALIVGVTLAAPYVGPEASGLLSAFPVMGVILTVFAHRTVGPAGGQLVMRGMVAGLTGYAVFFLVLWLALPRWSLVAAYGSALAAALVIQAGSLRRMRSDGGKIAG